MFRTLLLSAAASATLAFAAQAQVVVSSKIDTEGGVLGNIILAVLDNAGIETENRVQLGATPVVRQALVACISIVPRFHEPVAQSHQGQKKRAKGEEKRERTCFCTDMHSLWAQPSVDFNVLVREPSTKLSNLGYAAFNELLASSSYEHDSVRRYSHREHDKNANLDRRS